MKRFLLTLLFTITTLSLVRAQTNHSHTLRAQVLSSLDSLPLSGAHLINTTTGRAAIAGPEGKFSLEVQAGDSLRISFVGYQSRSWAVATLSESIRQFYLNPADEQLTEVVVEGLPSERILKNRILALELPEEDRVTLDLPPWAAQPAPSSDGVSVVSFRGGISGLASRFNKKDRGRAFRAQIQQRAVEQEIIDRKYNDQIIRRATGIASTEKLEAFKAYCSLSRNFILSASEYEIHRAIAECFGEFKASQG